MNTFCRVHGIALTFCLCCAGVFTLYWLFILEDSLNELNVKGIKKLHNFMRREEEREAW